MHMCEIAKIRSFWEEQRSTEKEIHGWGDNIQVSRHEELTN